MVDIFGGFSCIRFAGYLELRGVPLIIRGTSICVGYLYLYGVPLIVGGISICVGYLRLCRNHSIGRHVALYCLSYFSLKHNL